MIYGSVCSGIEAATVAWHPLGWRPAFFSEIETFPRAVLSHHYPDVPLHGDFTTIQEGDYAAIDVLVGGTPCQDFSLAGLRAGLDGERGNLTLEFLRLAQRLRPRWVVWENVPGVLSNTSHGAPDPSPPPPPVDLGCDGAGMETEDEYAAEELHAFNSILAGFSELGYGWAYRVLDAQYIRVDGYARAVPQRRRRVILVGYLGDWRRAAAVLFEREGMSGHPPPHREAGQNPAPTLAARTRGGGGLGTDFDCDGGLVAHTLNAKGGAGRMDYESETLIAHTLRGGGFDASEDGTGRGTPLVPTLAYRVTGNDGAYETHDASPCLGTGTDPSHTVIQHNWRVRRLTPVECERLQGFPDGYTAIPYRGKPAADGPRYKSLGNSMAVNVMRWIGRRIAMVDAIREAA